MTITMHYRQLCQPAKVSLQHKEIPVLLAEPQEPAQKLYMGRLQRFHENEAVGGT